MKIEREKKTASKPSCVRYNKEAERKRKATQEGTNKSPIIELWGTVDCINNHSRVVCGNTTVAHALYKHIICQTLW